MIAELPLLVNQPGKLYKLKVAPANDKPVVAEAARLSGYAESIVLRVV